MSRGNPTGFEMGIERSCGPGEIGKDASTTSVPRIARISHEILRDLGMSDDEIAQYFYRFRHDRSEQFVQMVLHKHGWMRRGRRGHMSNEGAVSWPKRNTAPSRRRAQRRLA
jgi:hypothetical protein